MMEGETELKESKLTESADEPADLSAVEGGQDRPLDEPAVAGEVREVETPLNMSNEDQSLNNSTLTYTTAFDDNNDTSGGGGGAGSNPAELASGSSSALTATTTTVSGQQQQAGSDSDVYKDTRESLDRDSTTTNTESAAPDAAKNGAEEAASDSDADDDDDDDPSKYEDSRQQPEDSVHESSPPSNGADVAGEGASSEDEDDADDENESGLPDQDTTSKTEPAAEGKPAARRLKHQSTNGSNSSASIDPATIPAAKKGGKFFQHDDRQQEDENDEGESSKAAAAADETAAEVAEVKDEVKVARKSPEHWSHDKFKQDGGARKPKQQRNRNRNSKAGDEQIKEEKPATGEAGEAGAAAPKAARPKKERPPREPQAKETSTSDVKEDTPPPPPRTPKPKGQGRQKATRPPKPQGDADLPLSEYIESTESGGNNRRRPDGNNKQPPARRSSDTNEAGQQQRPKFGPTQNAGPKEPRPAGRRRSDTDERPAANQQQQQRRAQTDKKSEPSRNSQPRGLNPDLRKRLDFSTRVQTYDDELLDEDDDGFEGLESIDPVSLKITVNRNAPTRKVTTASPDDAQLVVAAAPRQQQRPSNPSNKFKPSQSADQNLGQPRRADRYDQRGNGSYHPRSNADNGHPAADHYHYDQYQDHRQQQHVDQNRPRGPPRNTRPAADQGSNLSDYLQYSGPADNRSVPFVKSQSFSNSKLRNPNRNPPSHIQQQQQQPQQQSFSDYQPSSHSLAPQHEQLSSGNGNLEIGHFHHQQTGQFGMYQHQSQGGVGGGGFREQGRQIRGAGAGGQDHQRPFASNSPFDAARHFSQLQAAVASGQQQQQQFHSLTKSGGGQEFNHFNLLNQFQQQQQFYNDQGQN